MAAALIGDRVCNDQGVPGLWGGPRTLRTNHTYAPLSPAECHSLPSSLLCFSPSFSFFWRHVLFFVEEKCAPRNPVFLPVDALRALCFVLFDDDGFLLAHPAGEASTAFDHLTEIRPRRVTSQQPLAPPTLLVLRGPPSHLQEEHRKSHGPLSVPAGFNQAPDLPTLSPQTPSPPPRQPLAPACMPGYTSAPPTSTAHISLTPWATPIPAGLAQAGPPHRKCHSPTS